MILRLESEMNVDQQIAEFAKQVGIHPADIRCAAVGVCNALTRMKSVRHFIGHEERRELLCSLAMEEHVKKFEQFVCAHKSRKGMRDAVAQFVLAEIADLSMATGGQS